MSQQSWVEKVSSVIANGTAVANSTTETILFPNITVPANYLTEDRRFRLRATLMYGTTATPTLILALRWGGVAGTVIAKTGTITTGSAVGGGASMTAVMSIDAIVHCRARGSSGSLMTNGDWTVYTTGTAGGTAYPIVSGATGGTTPVAVTVDLTADTAMALTALWGTANAANSIQGIDYALESLA
jgi:hypothetical protein